MALEELTSAKATLGRARDIDPSSPRIRAVEDKLEAAIAARAAELERAERERIEQMKPPPRPRLRRPPPSPIDLDADAGTRLLFGGPFGRPPLPLTSKSPPASRTACATDPCAAGGAKHPGRGRAAGGDQAALCGAPAANVQASIEDTADPRRPLSCRPRSLRLRLPRRSSRGRLSTLDVARPKPTTPGPADPAGEALLAGEIPTRRLDRESVQRALRQDARRFAKARSPKGDHERGRCSVSLRSLSSRCRC